jgi:hypothetical protein
MFSSLPDAVRFGGSTLLRMGTARLERRDAAYALSDKAFPKSSCSYDREWAVSRENNSRCAMRLIVERLSADSLDVRELKRLGMLQDGRWGLPANLRWPSLSRLVGSRYFTPTAQSRGRT